MIKSKKARKQRKYLYNAPLHKKRKWIASHLEENLLLKYDRRSIPVIKGDTVKVMRGNFKGHEDKISHVNVKKQIVEIEGLTMIKADGKKIAKPIHPSNVLITKLNLTDSWRRDILERGLSEDSKKEIEREAKEQLREQELAKKKAEEDAKKEEERKKAEEAAEKEEAQKETKETEPPSAEPEIKEEKPAEETKEEPAIEPEEKKTKKTPVKKTVPKKKKEAKP